MRVAPRLLGLVPLAAGAVLAAEPADLALTGGRVYTLDVDLEVVEALAVKDGLIVAAGSDDEIAGHVGPATRVLALDGAFVMPGFNDAHLHLGNAALVKLSVDLSGAASLAELQARVGAALADRPPGQWLYGRGWDESLWPTGTVPTRLDLDAISSEHPMLLERADGHSAVVNSLALERAEIGVDTPDPDGGVIVRDAAGLPTGWLKEKAADRVLALIPEPDARAWEAGLRLAMEEALAHGVTSIQDDSLRAPGQGPAVLDVIQGMHAAGELPLRITEWLPFEAPVPALVAWRDRLGTRDPWLKAGLLKTNIDGSGGSLSAAMLAPYTDDPDNRGLLLIEPDALVRMVAERDAAGFQIGIHAIGDRANRVVLDAYAAAARANGRRDARHRIEHAQFVTQPDVRRFSALGIIPSVQPGHLLTDLRWAPRVLGPARERDAYRWYSFLAAGSRLAFGTDYPVEPIDPMRVLYAAVARRFEDGQPEGGWHMEEAVSIHAALHAYTMGAAYAEFEETRKGSLTPGKLADFVVLSADPTAVAPPRLLDIRVLRTFVGGEERYTAEDPARGRSAGGAG